MLQPTIIDLDYTYRKTDSEVSVLNFDSLPLDLEKITDRQIVRLEPLAIGGNHKHPRTEWFVGFGDLVLVWLDQRGQKHEEEMVACEKVRLIMVPPLLPHAVINRSHTQIGILLELANAKMENVEKVEVVPVVI